MDVVFDSGDPLWLHHSLGILSSRFASLSVFRVTDPDSAEFRQIAHISVRHETRVDTWEQ
jgi:hypothetical protein